MTPTKRKQRKAEARLKGLRWVKVSVELDTIAFEFEGAIPPARARAIFDACCPPDKVRP